MTKKAQLSEPCLDISDTKRLSRYKRVNPQYRPYISKVIPLKLFLDIVPSSFADITRALRECFRGQFISFRFVSTAKENLQRCGNVFFDILITSKGTSALGMF